MKLKLCVVLLSLFSIIAAAAPEHVIIIRHGEKPADKKNDTGSLSPEGQERARKLVDYFTKTLANKYGVPVAIYAFRNKQNGKRFRGIETITPLAASLGIAPDSTFEEGDEKHLVKYILKSDRYDGKTVLICWEHHLIHTILKDLGMDHAPDYPDDAFDRTYIVDFDKDGGFKAFHDLGQGLMPGDSKNKN